MLFSRRLIMHSPIPKHPFHGNFGPYGGRYVPEVLRGAIDELETMYLSCVADPAFWAEYDALLADFVGRPTPLLHAANTSKLLGGAQVYIKLEGLAATGAHKINNALGQALLAKRLGKTRIIAETGAGQHGVATAAMCAKLGLPCRIYMGEVDVARQRPNVFWMEMYGAEVVPVVSGSKTLKDAVNEAMRDWASNFTTTHYLIGSALGPSPFPDMVREFQSVIGREVREQCQTKGIVPHALVACVGGGSNAMGLFGPFLADTSVKLYGVEAGGRGSNIGDHAARMNDLGKTGIVQGYKSKFLQNSDGQLQETHSISAGLDYPGIGPQLAWLGDSKRVNFMSASDQEALEALKFFARNEGVIFAMESSHAAAGVLKLAPTLKPNQNIILNMSGRGDKDLFITAKAFSPEIWRDFLRSEANDCDRILAAKDK